jgi:hypothetical protein
MSPSLASLNHVVFAAEVKGRFASYGFARLALDLRPEDQERLDIGEAERLVAQTYCAFRAE